MGKRAEKIKYRFLAGTLLLTGCSVNSSTDKKEDMAVHTQKNSFQLTGKWQIVSTGAGNAYTMPEFLIFKDNNTYAAEGKEGDTHPVLDGGYYRYDTEKKILQINTSNDEIKSFKINEKNGSFIIYENDLLIAEYRKKTDKHKPG